MRDTGLGQGADVVLGFIEKCEVKAGSTTTFENLFTSLPLLDELNELGIIALSTLQENPVANKTTLAKKPRGSHDCATNGKKLVVSFKHSSTVVKFRQGTSSCTNAETFQQASGWCLSVRLVCVYILSSH